MKKEKKRRGEDRGEESLSLGVPAVIQGQLIRLFCSHLGGFKWTHRTD